MKLFFRLLIFGVALAFIASACGSSGGDSNAAASNAGASNPVTGAASCPDRVIIQTDWFPEPEHGYLYQLIGTNGDIDANRGTYSGPLGDSGLTLEIRAGGPYLSQANPAAQFYSDPDILLAYVNTSDSIETYKTTPTVHIFTSFEKGPQILMWNPDRYSFQNFQELGASGATILHFGGAGYIDFLAAQELIDKDNADGSYDGSPGRFIAEGDLVQQGFATNEPYRYENDIEGWQRPVDFLLLHDSGYEIYQSAISVRPETLTERRECLKFLVPIFQQGLVDYMASPTSVNVRLDEIVKTLDSFWTSSIPGHNNATRIMKDEGLVSDAGNGYVGDMDEDRIQRLIDNLTPIYRDQGVDGFGNNDDRLRASTLFTNEFLDTSIKLGF